MRAMMGRERCEEEVEVGEDRMRLKRCHASLGLLVLLCRALIRAAGSILTLLFLYIWRDKTRSIVWVSSKKYIFWVMLFAKAIILQTSFATAHTTMTLKD